MAIKEHTTNALNSLLRGELAAVETYQQALTKADQNAAPVLRQILQDHQAAANDLRQHVHQMGGKADVTSGAWGAFAKAVEGTANLLGNRPALQSLKGGEEQGVKDYEKTLQDPDLPAECHALILSKLLPQTRSHVGALDGLLAK